MRQTKVIGTREELENRSKFTVEELSQFDGKAGRLPTLLTNAKSTMFPILMSELMANILENAMRNKT
jgi:hypothetical protein